MKRRILTEETAVSPVIATILMVAITVVLAATLYMMLPEAGDTDELAAMSGSRERRDGDRWIISISAGNVPFDNGENFRLYDTTTGASHGPDGAVLDEAIVEAELEGYDEGSKISIGEDSYPIWFNDNSNDGRVRGGDTIVIYDPDRNLENLEFRISGTSLTVRL